MAPRNLFSTSLPRCDGAAPPPLLVLGMMVKPAEVRLRQVMRSLYQQGVPRFTDMAERVSLHFFCLRVVGEAHRRSGNETAEAMDSETNNARDIFLLDETLPGSLADAPETACIASGLLCGRLLLALVESVLRPGGWENMCRLMCHCVRHIGLDNKHGRSVEAIHSFLSRWKAGTELCAGTQKSRAARRARWGARTARGAHPGFGSPP